MNFYPFHIGDYISHTSHLTDAEDLTYRRMIDLYYQSEQPFNQNEIKQLARKVKSTVEVVEILLDEFFTFSEDDGCWHNSRADTEIAKYHFLSESGKKGAEKRWGNRDKKPLESDPNSPPIATPLATKNQEPRTKNHINTKTPEGVSDSVFQDFLKLRKQHRAPLTETALKGLAKEAEKAKLSLQEVMEICCQRGWRGFKADWVIQEAQKSKEMPLGNDKQIEEAYRVECGGDPAKARFNSYFEMKKFIIDQREKRAKQ
jgi:uncharacterized protein YdaU (DUF1376 family)